MWTTLFFCVLVGLTSAENAWKPGNQYTYQVSGRTLAGLHQVSNQFSGVFLKAKLEVHVDSEEQLTLKINDAKYADVHTTSFSNGWDSELPLEEVLYKNLPSENKPFQLRLKNGTIDKMVVEDGIDVRELNFMKAVATQLQVDTKGENLKSSKINHLPNRDQGFGVYKTMEDSVNGVYETVYDLSPLPDYIAESRPELVPLPHLRGNGQFIEIEKTRNFSSSEKHVIYRYGANGHEGFTVGSNHMGNSLSRSSVSRIIISGHLDRYTIQSSVTVEKVLIAPHLYNGQKGLVVSSMNLTLKAVANSQGPAGQIENPKVIDNLVYQPVNEGDMPDSSEECDSSSSSSESGSSSSESSSSSSESGSSEGSSSDDSSTSEPDTSSSSNSTSSSSSEDSSSPDSQETSTQSNLKFNRIRRMIKTLKPRTTLNEQENSSGSSGSSSEDSSDSSSSMSSSDEWVPGTPGLNEVPNNEFLPEYMGGWGSQQVDYVEKIKQLAEEIGAWAQKPDRAHELHVLEKFSLLTSLVASSNIEQLSQACQTLCYHGKEAPSFQEREQSQKYQASIAFQNAVAQAGTGPALVTIREWIDSGKVKGEEAAQLVAVLTNSARYPTTEYMNYFFEMVQSDVVLGQQFLNNSAIMSFTDLVRKSQVDKETARNRYSIRLLDRESEEGTPVVDKYIPWLQAQLQDAVSQGDSIKIQVFIRALGNVAHPKILSVFEPYLEGDEPMSNFQRLTIVAALDELTWVHPNTARKILYGIYQNTGETHEVRVAAVMQLMKTNPPAQMLQRMAQNTNSDHSEQVNAAVKSAIESAAYKYDPKDEDFSEFNQNARAAVDLLTSKNYGVQYSRNFLRSYILKENVGYERQMSSINEKSYFYPSSLFYAMYQRAGGYHLHPITYSYMTSSVEDLYRLLSIQYINAADGQQLRASRRMDDNARRSASDYTYRKIVNKLKLETDQQHQVEGNVFLNLFGGKRLFAFDNHTIEQLPGLFAELGRDIQNGKNVQYTKYFNEHSIEMGFPVAMGVPFYYSLQKPTVVSLRGHFKGTLEPSQGIPVKAQLDAEFDIGYASHLRGKVGFVYPFSNNRYIAGFDKNQQIYAPLKAKVQFNSKESSLQADLLPVAHDNQKQRVFLYKTVAYTHLHEYSNINPYGESKNAMVLHVRPAFTYQNTVGQSETGHAFDIEVESEQGLDSFAIRYYKQLTKAQDLFSFLADNGLEETIANDYISATYNPQMSSESPVELSLRYKFEDLSNAEPSDDSSESNGPVGNDGPVISEASTPEERINRYFQMVKEGIQDAQVTVVDAAISFNGGGNGRGGYSLTFSHADSPVSEQSRILSGYTGIPYKQDEQTKPFSASVLLNFVDPQLPIFNYKEAIHADPASAIHGKISFVQDSKTSFVAFEGQMDRTQERKAHVQQDPISHLCENQMQQGNNIQSACRNATIQAHFLNKYKLEFDISGAYPPVVNQILGDLLNAARYAGFRYVKEQPADEKNKGMVIGVEFSSDLKNVNVSVDTSTISTRFDEMPVPEWLIPFVVYHPAHNQLKMYGDDLSYIPPQVSAILDGNMVTTFDNKSYPIDLGNCYHVFAMYAPHENFDNHDDSDINRNEDQHFAVLVREVDSNRKELQVVIEHDYIKIKGSSGSSGYSVVANGEELNPSEHKITNWSNNIHHNYFITYVLPKNKLVLYFPTNGLQLIYDGNRVKLSVSSHYRCRIRGLAGAFNSRTAEDFSMPNNRVLGAPLEFAATYALTRDSPCTGPAKQRQQNAQRMQSYAKNYVFGDYIDEANVEQNRNTQKKIRKNQSGTQGSCSNYNVKVLHRDGKTCYSIRTQLECGQNCQPTSLIKKKIEFHCAKSSRATSHWEKMIKQGQLPNFSKQTVNYSEYVALPESCAAQN